MKDKLEKFIAENQESFDFYEPGDEVWNNVKNNIKQGKVIKFNYRTLLVRVAAALIIFFSSYYFHDFMQNRENRKRISFRERLNANALMIPELIETEAFYASQVTARLVELKQYTSEYPDIEDDILYDLNELDRVYAEIKKDLKDNVANNEVVEALIQNYRLKLKILEDLLIQLKQTENQNTNKNEQQIHEL